MVTYYYYSSSISNIIPGVLALEIFAGITDMAEPYLLVTDGIYDGLLRKDTSWKKYLWNFKDQILSVLEYTSVDGLSFVIFPDADDKIHTITNWDNETLAALAHKFVIMNPLGVQFIRDGVFVPLTNFDELQHTLGFTLQADKHGLARWMVDKSKLDIQPVKEDD